ncbi:MAG: DUF4347 domain-containing protein, partial [Pirellulaceae bacterium]
MLGKFFAKLDSHLRAQQPKDGDVRSIDEIELDVLALEDRILYSAVPMVDAEAPVDADVSGDAMDSLFVADLPDDNAEVSAENSDGQSPDGELSLDDLPATPLDLDSDVSRELIFIDTGVEDFQQLLDDITSGGDDSRDIEVVLLDPTRDGFAQISEALAGRIDIDAIHIVSHGSDGQVHLGDSVLNNETLAERSSEIADWGSSLDVDADLLFYGCDLAGNEGRSLIDAIAELCDCDVAASDDVTGHEDLGGDWILEYTVGDVSTDVAFGYMAQASWRGALDTTTDLVAHYEFEEGTGTTADDSTANNNDGSFINTPSWNSDAAVGDFSLDFTGDASGSNKVVTIPDDASLDVSGDFTVAFWYNFDTTQANSSRMVGSHDGSQGFSIYADAAGNLNFFLQGSTTSQTVTLFNYAIADGEWHHVAASRSGNSIRLVIDGGINTTTTTDVGTVGPAAPLTIGGASATSGDFDGMLDDVRVYTRTLSFSDINELVDLNVVTEVTVDTTADYASGHADYGDTSSIAALLRDKGADGLISLRESIDASNNQLGTDTINFNIAGSGTQVIELASLLPQITDSLIIDGTTQNGWVEGSFLPIVIDGNSLSGSGLTLNATADNSEIRGLLIRDIGTGITINDSSSGNTIAGNWIGQFNSDGTDAGVGEAITGDGMFVDGDNNTIGGVVASDRNVINERIYLYSTSANNNLIAGNFLGTDTTGNSLLASGSAYQGVVATNGANNNTIGGATDDHRNIIAGTTYAIDLEDSGTDSFVIQNNRIGLGADGTTVLGNTNIGIYLYSGDNHVIGGVGAGNEILDSGTGILVGESVTGVTIYGNFIGTNETGTVTAGNDVGVLFEWGANQNQLGGINAGEGNVITASSGAGVVVDSTTMIPIRNTIRGNSIYGNAGLGIDLGNDGVTANDTGSPNDADSGANNLQNWAEINSVESNVSNELVYDIDTTALASGTYTIDFYASTDVDGGQVEGKRYLGTITGVADGQASLTGTLAASTIADSEHITLVTTDASGNSSEFSRYATPDTDGDGVFDSVDLDDDNDGILDSIEDAAVATTSAPPEISSWTNVNGTSVTGGNGTLTYNYDGAASSQWNISTHSEDFSTLGYADSFRFSFSVDQANTKNVMLGLNESGT